MAHHRLGSAALLGAAALTVLATSACTAAVGTTAGGRWPADDDSVVLGGTQQIGSANAAPGVPRH